MIIKNLLDSELLFSFNKKTQILSLLLSIFLSLLKGKRIWKDKSKNKKKETKLLKVLILVNFTTTIYCICYIKTAELGFHGQECFISSTHH